MYPLNENFWKYRCVEKYLPSQQLKNIADPSLLHILNHKCLSQLRSTIYFKLSQFKVLELDI